MAKNVKKNKRRATLLRLRGEFLGIEGAKYMSIKRLTPRIRLVTGTQKFLTYVVSADRLSEWEEFLEKHGAESKRVKRHLSDAETDIDVDRKNHQSIRRVEDSSQGVE